MVDLNLIMQRQRVVALAPVVADAGRAVHDQGVDLQLAEAGGDAKPGLAAADHQHGRITVGIFSRGVPQVEPVRTAKIT